jgi:bla regulator protein BlaR1
MAWFLTTALSNAAVVALLAGPVWLLARWARRPALTHALWVLLLVKLVTPPLVSVALPWELPVAQASLREWLSGESERLSHAGAFSAKGAADRSTAALELSAQGPSGSGGTNHAMAERPLAESVFMAVRRWITPHDGLTALLGVWSLGSLVLLLGVARQAGRFRRQLRDSLGSSRYLEAEVQRAAESIGLRRSPRAVFVDGIVSPMLWGIGPCVWLVFPRGLWDRLNVCERRALVVHELGHYARRDPWVRLLELTCSVVYWWHPAVWWARRAIETSGEECCDALVIEWEGTPRTYAEAIVSTLDFLAEGPARLPPLASGVSDVPALKSRLVQIMQRTVAARLPRAARGGVLTFCAATMLVHPFLPLAPAAAMVTRSLVTEPTAVDLTTTIQQRVTAKGAAKRLRQPERVELPEPPSGWWSPVSQRWAVATSPNGASRLVAETGRRVRLESLTSDAKHDLSDASITCAAYLPSGDRFVTGSTRGDVQLWDADRGESISLLGHLPAAINSIGIDPDGRFAVTGGSDGVVIMWELSSGAIAGTWTSPQASPITAVGYSADGSTIVAAASDWRSPRLSLVCAIDGVTLQTSETIRLPGSVAAVRCELESVIRVATWDGRLQDWRRDDAVVTPAGSVAAGPLAAAAFSPQGVL